MLIMTTVFLNVGHIDADMRGVYTCVRNLRLSWVWVELYGVQQGLTKTRLITHEFNIWVRYSERPHVDQ